MKWPFTPQDDVRKALGIRIYGIYRDNKNPTICIEFLSHAYPGFLRLHLHHRITLRVGLASESIRHGENGDFSTLYERQDCPCCGY